MPHYAELVYNGFWFSPEREALQALVDKTQEFVTGIVRLKLYKVWTDIVTAACMCAHLCSHGSSCLQCWSASSMLLATKDVIAHAAAVCLL